MPKNEVELLIEAFFGDEINSNSSKQEEHAKNDT